MNSSLRARTRAVAALWVLLAGAAPTAALAAITSPEQDSLAVASGLRPIPDAEWNEVAGPSASQVYSVAPGDTLSDISLRLFGDARYWPKIWALNNENITNPHLIRPGKQVVFSPGSGTTLPTLAIQDGPGSAAGAPEQVANRGSASRGTLVASRGSQEWRRLPPQPWERVTVAPPASIDAQGFDKRSKIVRRAPDGFELELVTATGRIGVLGEIKSGRFEAIGLGLSTEVFIVSPGGQLQVGDTYGIVDEPKEIESGGRKGFSYVIAGKVRIIGVKDGLFIGRITASSTVIERGFKLIALPARLPNLSPIAAQSPLEGILSIDRRDSLYTTAQHKLVIVNRGSEDGVEPGMVFRVFQEKDPYTGIRISDSNLAKNADLQVIQVSERFSVARVMSSEQNIEENARAVLLTDVSDFERDRSTREIKTDLSGDTVPSDLDRVEKIDTSGDLGKKEEAELRQLEDHDETTEPEDQLIPEPEPTGEAPKPSFDALDPSEMPPPIDGDLPAPEDEDIPLLLPPPTRPDPNASDDELNRQLEELNAEP